MNYEGLTLRRDPYVVGIAPEALKPEVHEGLCRKWPSEATVKWSKMGEGYNKLSLSERNNPEVYYNHINSSNTWKRLHKHLKSPEFIEGTFEALRRKKVKIVGGYAGNFTSRWELSSMPADGGFILPHRDIASKVVTIVVPCGGFQWGMDVLKPRQRDMRDYEPDWTKFDFIERLLAPPTGAVVFVKNDISWHSVGPMTGPAGEWRRSLTINIERKR